MPVTEATAGDWPELTGEQRSIITEGFQPTAHFLWSDMHDLIFPIKAIALLILYIM